MTTQKNLEVTFSVTALVSPEEFAKYMGSPETEMPAINTWDEEDLEHCIHTYCSEFSGYHRYFKITDRQVVKVEETDEAWDPSCPPDSQAEMKIKAMITSTEPVRSDLPESDCDAITYSIIKPSELLPGGDFYTEVLMTIDQAKARAWIEAEREGYEEHDPESAEGYVWVGNVFKSGYWDSPECAIVEDDIAPGGYQDEVEVEYLSVQAERSEN